MPFENGVNWQPKDPEKRGRHRTFLSAVESAVGDLVTERSDFYDSLCDNWKALFPTLPARPGRLSDGVIFIYVRNAPTSFVVRPKLRQIKAKLLTLPGAPKTLDLRLEIHAR